MDDRNGDKPNGSRPSNSSRPSNLPLFLIGIMILSWVVFSELLLKSSQADEDRHVSELAAR